MDLSKLQINQKAVLTSIEGISATKKRLRSFGLDVGSQIEIKQKSITNSNIEIASKYGLIALRNEEAKMISCKLVDAK
ncbi:FeoA family protein [Campylobacter hyointestinalis]|uniref:FeoA domain-containing protein n=1 Tax=Campylobacter hyointestinalis subsp. hyointestinalis TaxID=91352 RepID=A0A855N2P7_CAMHY|nr:FeoA family protein [Campylobacter hyointestinalis]ANE32938.1 ferrous iron transport protein A [Campylobacter hyointestinalis subsp. hyointestinalis LMG 9260]KEA43941.1 iron transporter FeoA [Campylobacter hyointestinalis subsp. hyointestinalis]MBT0611734.1 ferrous iron transport protein A [Campylobacter hyointestinalis subsp. hyointestinalis]MDL2347402.1 FeoA family protein [Campylobacter hyointestinalis]MDL2349137.1 FeoA family protein [Campylobacter hyointestinalis]